jgi:predicted DNA binding CopG/RHH family protein
MKEKVILPKFSTEAEEAEWWDSHHKLVEDTLLEALENGETQQGMARKLTQHPRDSDSLPVHIPADYIHRARKLAEKKGIGYDTYMQMLLKEALDRESRKST